MNKLLNFIIVTFEFSLELNNLFIYSIDHLEASFFSFRAPGRSPFLDLELVVLQLLTLGVEVEVLLVDSNYVSQFENCLLQT